VQLDPSRDNRLEFEKVAERRNRTIAIARLRSILDGSGHPESAQAAKRR